MNVYFGYKTKADTMKKKAKYIARTIASIFIVKSFAPQ